MNTTYSLKGIASERVEIEQTKPWRLSNHLPRALCLAATTMLAMAGAAHAAPPAESAPVARPTFGQFKPGTGVAVNNLHPVPGTIIDSKSTNRCCPAVMTGPFSNYFGPDQLPGKNLAQSYGLHFLSTFVYGSSPETIPQTLTLDQQMMPFAFYIGSPGAGILPAGKYANSVHLTAEIREVLPTGTPAGTALPSDWSAPFAMAHLVSNGDVVVRAWWAGGMPPTANPNNVWDGSGGPTGFHAAFMDGQPRLAPNYLQPNKTYMMKMALKLFYKDLPDDTSWHSIEIPCSNMKSTFYWNHKVGNLSKLASGGASAVQIQFNELK